jgi:hypothetical protein
VHNNLLRGDNGRLQAIDSAPATRPETTSVLGSERRVTAPRLNEREVVARRQPNRPASTAVTNNGAGINISTTPRDGREASGPGNVRVITGNPVRMPAPNSNRGPNNETGNETGQGANADFGNRAGATAAQPARTERSTVNTPYIRPQPQRSSPNDNTGSRSANEGGNPAVGNSRNVDRSPVISPDTSASPPLRPNSAGTAERGTRNNSWVRDEAPLRRSSEPQVQTPSAPAMPRNEPAQREQRPQPQPRAEPMPQPSAQQAPDASNPTSESPLRTRRREVDTR